MALSQHLEELERELAAVTPLFEALKDKVQVLNDVVRVIRADEEEDPGQASSIV